MQGINHVKHSRSFQPRPQLKAACRIAHHSSQSISELNDCHGRIARRVLDWLRHELKHRETQAVKPSEGADLFWVRENPFLWLLFSRYVPHGHGYRCVDDPDFVGPRCPLNLRKAGLFFRVIPAQRAHVAVRACHECCTVE
jgi:hypothetical protein